MADSDKPRGVGDGYSKILAEFKNAINQMERIAIGKIENIARKRDGQKVNEKLQELKST